MQITKLNKDDFLNNKQIYREILNSFSPILLAYIDKMRFDYDISVVAGLLSLKNKGYIEICEGELNVIKHDFSNLSMSERFIIENIRNGKVENASRLEYIVYEEAVEKNLLILNKRGNKKFLKSRDIPILLLGLWSLAKLIPENSVFVNIIKNILGISIIPGVIYSLVYTSKIEKNLYRRSGVAKELNQKLEGLKNYIGEYSLLKEKMGEDITIWEDYLIYSVIFNQNQKIIEEYQRYY